MIVRTWSATTSLAREAQYIRTVKGVVLPRFEKADGYLASSFLRREVPGGIRYLVLTYWESMAAVRKLAGDDPTRAYVPAEIAATLDDYDRTADHHEVVIQHGALPR
jgi:heme-degrading monooxygenase HmoA